MFDHQHSPSATTAEERLAAAQRLLIGCDFDGTISPIVGNPHDARPLPGAVPSLIGLAGLPRTYVALITGRARRDLAQLVAEPPGVVLIGSHGAEWGSDFGETLDAQQAALLREITREAGRIVSDAPGCLIERKPASVAVHVRGAERPVADRVLAAVESGPAARPGVVVIRGKKVLEMAVVHTTKGAAVAKLRELFEPTLTVYIGDDRTDEDGFAVLGPDDLGIRVGPGPTCANMRLGGPVEVVQLLASVLKRRRGRTGRESPGAARG